MDYKNEICNGCNQPIKDGEDIVVCPVCGTPQHRSCWQENNDCVNSRLHSDGFVWKKSVPVEPEVAKEPTVEHQAESHTNLPPVFTQLAQEAQNLESAFLRDQAIYKEEEIDGIKVTDAAYYLQSGAHRYIKRFRRKKKVTWNWGAFFFAPAWFFYRKLYKFGAVFLAAVVAINLFSYSFAESIAIQLEDVYTVMEEVINTEGDSMAASEELMKDQQFVDKYMVMLKNFGIYLLITGILPNTVAALVADYLVKKKMKEDIHAAKEASDDLQMQRSLMISKGGVAPLIFAIVYFANDYLVSILINIGSMVSEFFK